MPEDYRVADFIADFISDELKLSHIFLVTGAGIMHLTDGIAKNKKIKSVALHHEQSCSMAADSYSKFNNDFSVSMYSTGPAATNALTGLAGAWQDSVPSLFISGQVKTSESTLAQGLTQAVRQFGVQELNVGPMVQSVSKYFMQVRDPRKIKFELQKAVHIARSGRPGPVWLEIPMDVQASKIDKELLEGYFPERKSVGRRGSSEMTIKEIAELLESSERPVVLAGRGVYLSKGSKVLEDFAVSRNVPIVSTYLGIDGLHTNSNNYIGKVGVKGSRAGNLAIQNADLILALGTSLHVSSTGYEYKDFGRAAKLIVIDIDLESHGKSTVKVFGRIEMDAREFITQLSGTLGVPTNEEISPWLTACLNWRSKYPVSSKEYSTGPAINIYKFVDSLSKLAPDHAIFVSDAGSAYYAVSQGVELSTESHRYITSGAMATMGFTVPAAIGASFSSNEEVPILAVTGDGSLQQNIQELQVIVQYRLPIKLFILNNNGYLSIRASQKNYFESREIGAGPESGLTFPDVLKIADAYGIPARRVTDLSELESAITHAISSPGPFVLDVVTPPDQLIVPTVSSRIDEAGVMRSRPLEDMFPFLEREEFLSNLFVEPI
jgi:acetolactate synthase-1/2/3 large subunit